MSEHIPVFLASDDFYAPFIATTIASIMRHTQSFIDFYILTDGISDENKRKIDRLHEIYQNWTIEYLFVDTDKYLKDFPYIKAYSFASYNRYFIANLKPEIKKAIYSDVDVIYRDDIKKMYNIDLDGYGIGAPIEELGKPLWGKWNHELRKKQLGISNQHNFFQSGNLIIDCEYWRKNNIMERCFELTQKYKNILVCPDLDVLNMIFENKYKRLDYRFSICTHIIGKEDGNTEMLNSYKKPFCIHYAGLNKPWKFPTVYFSDYFWECARQTPFYEEILLRMVQSNTVISNVAVNKEMLKHITQRFKYRLRYLKYKLLKPFVFGKLRKKYKQKKKKYKSLLKQIKNYLK